jgi:hypothetical protein
MDDHDRGGSTGVKSMFDKKRVACSAVQFAIGFEPRPMEVDLKPERGLTFT